MKKNTRKKAANYYLLLIMIILFIVDCLLNGFVKQVIILVTSGVIGLTIFGVYCWIRGF